VIRPDNVDKVTGINRMDKISVIRMDWIESGNWLVNAGSNAVSFIDAQTLTVKQKVTLDGGIPLSMTTAGDRVYILLNNSIKVIDAGSFSVVKTLSPIAGGAMSIAVSPDGKLLALGISDNKTQLLNAEDGSVVRNLKSNYGGWSVAFSPDSQIIVSGTSQGVLRWETATGIWQITSGGQDKIIRSLAFSHDGKTIAGAGDGFIYFWNAADGELLNQATGLFGLVNSLDFSPDDSMLVSGTADNIVRIWDVGTASVLKELPGHASQVLGVCFSPDQQRIASGAGIEATIRIWGLP
jgi:WD40 repeat protein